MVTRIGGFRRKTRHKLSKPLRRRGKISTSRYFKQFNVGDTVVLSAEPAVQKGMYNPVFHGKSGLVIGRRGTSYEVLVQDRKVEKMLIVHPVHLRGVSQ
jgi:large subunit ribosomal protein L21e